MPEKAKVRPPPVPIWTRLRFVLGNIRNHFVGVGGPDKVTIALVAHGPALKAFQAASACAQIAHRRSGLGAFAEERPRD